ncbi:MarR family transcriptional regulator [Saccharomonospora sp. NPDC006951]
MHERVANLLGATALAVTDRVLAEAWAGAGVSPSGAAALVVLSTGQELSVTELGRRIGLSQSAAARMVDSLERKRLLERRPRHGREVTVGLTGEGRRVALGLLDARGTGLKSVLDVLSPDERRQLGDLLSTLLTRIYQDVGNADLLCRLCDRASCTTGAVCPVGQAQRDGPG